MLAFIALGSVFAAGVAAACIHPESGGAGVRAVAQEYAVVYARGRQVLLISTQLAPSEAAPPQALSLVTATPSLPDVYQTGDPELFDALYDWFNQELSNGPSRGGDVDVPGGVEVLPRVEAGPYGITPIMATGAEGVMALNDWLTQNGFEPVDRMLAQTYVDRGWYFLAVDIRPETMGEGLGEGRLPPLHLEFDSPEVVVPLKLEAGMGEFDVRIYLFLQGALPADVAGRYGLQAGTAGPAEERPASVTALLASVALATGASAEGFEAFELHSDGPFNTADAPLSDWPDDFAFEPPDAPEALPGMGGMPAGGGGQMGGAGGAGAGGAMTGGTASPADDDSAGDDGGCDATGGPGAFPPWAWMLLVLAWGRRRR